MTTIGFNFTKIEGEHFPGKAGKVKVNNNISIKKVIEDKLTLADTTNGVVKISFEYELAFEPKIGRMVLAGDLLELVPKADAEKIATSFKVDKALPKDMISKVMNAIFSKCQVQSIILAKDLNLPSPVPLRKISVDPKDKK
ncbi:MAG: hypothetical protein ACI8Y7_000977 [Candidatus Woesearchaeota archaeon]|jgi:hypothetical protein